METKPEEMTGRNQKTNGIPFKNILSKRKDEPEFAEKEKGNGKKTSQEKGSTRETATREDGRKE